ncbi:MAG: hypothetical protein IBX47_13655, partial [Desulfuromonadales bacterium]|nr:hypothetical protein [Desulfuromonadales bacterium]
MSAPQKVRNFLSKLKVFIKSCVALPTDIFIRRHNSNLRGWAQSSRQVVAKKVFGWVDDCVYHYLRKWMRHRYSNKTDAWLKRHYFNCVGMCSAFFAMSTNSHGEKQWLFDRDGTKRNIGGGKGNCKGTPQGGVISPLLSNLYLHILDRIWERNNLQQRLGARIVRYANDIVILCRRGKSGQAMTVLRQILERLQ